MRQPAWPDPPAAGAPVYLRDIWPTNQEVQDTVRAAVNCAMFEEEYAQAFDGDSNWQTMPVPTGDTYEWDDRSTYIKKPPYFDNMVDPATSIRDLAGLRVLAMLGDSVTTDHISPAGSIPSAWACRRCNSNPARARRALG
jgi:aconitate hydratase